MNIFHTFTRACLAKNRSRTLVTVIGIVLSMALFTAVLEGAEQARQVGRTVGEIGVHFTNIVVAVFERPLESGQVGGSQAQFPAALQQEQPVREFLLQAFHRIGGPVRGPVVDDQDVVIPVQGEYGARDLLDVLDFVVGRNDDQFFHITSLCITQIYKFCVHLLYDFEI